MRHAKPHREKSSDTWIPLISFFYIIGGRAGMMMSLKGQLRRGRIIHDLTVQPRCSLCRLLDLELLGHYLCTWVAPFFLLHLGGEGPTAAPKT